MTVNEKIFQNAIKDFKENYRTKKYRQIFSDISASKIYSPKANLPRSFFFCRYAILNEVWRLVADKVVNVEDIDKVISEGLGMRYAFLGAFETAHLNAEGMENYIDR